MSTKKLTEGAVLLAIYAVLLLIFLYVPLFGLLFTFVLPIPFIYYNAKYNWKDGIVFFIASLFISFIIGNFPAVTTTVLYGLTGFVLGVCLYFYKDRKTAFILGTLTYILTTLFLFALSIWLFNINYIQEMVNAFKEVTNESIAIMEMFGQEVPPEAIELTQTIVSLGIALIPTILVIVSGLSVWLIQLIAIPVVKRLGISVPASQPFRELTFPKSTIWYFLLVSLLSIVVPLNEGTFLYNVVLNFLSIFQIVFSIQGISFMFFFAHVKDISKSVPIVVTVITLLNPLLIQIVQILGIIDLGFDLRKRLKT